MEQYKEYFAFISYKREDEDWAKWLAHELEHYHLPLTLNGRDDLPKDLRPIFRDIDELSVGNLPQQINQALENSKNLIVICSPNVAKHSEWVDKEIEAFIKMGKIDRIFPFIIDGVPFAKNGEEECFPKALKDLPQKDEKIAANVSEYKDRPQRLCKDCPLPKESTNHHNQGNINDKGRDAAVVKIVAGMLGLNFDTLWQRYEKEKAEEEQRIKEQRNRLLKVQSRFLAEKVFTLIDKGEVFTARKLSLEALPKDINSPDRPYVPEAECALRESLASNCLKIKESNYGVVYSCMSPNEKLIASTSNDYAIRIWDAHNGTELIYINTGVLTVRNVDFSPDNTLFAAVWGRNLNIWDSNTGKLVLKIELWSSFYNSTAYFSPDGKRIVVCGLSILVFDLETSKMMFKIQCRTDFATYSPNGSYLISSSKYENGTIIVWDASNGHELYRINTGFDGITNVAFFSPDGSKIIALLENNWIIVLDTESKECLFNYDASSQKLYYANFSPDGHYFIAAESNQIKIWETQTWAEVQTISGHEKDVCSAMFCPDGKKVISASMDTMIRVWDVNLPQNYNNYCISTSQSLTTDGLKIAITGDSNSVHVLDLQTGKISCVLEGHLGQINCIAFSPNNKKLITASNDCTIKIWDANTGNEIKTLKGHKSTVCTAFYNNSGKYIISSSRDRTARIWDAISGEELHVIDEVGFYHCTGGFVAFHPNGQYIYAVCGYRICVLHWDFLNKPITIDELDDHDENVNYITLNSNGSLMATASEDKTVRIWNTETLKVIHKLDGHDRPVMTVFFSADDKYVISSSSDNITKVWDVKSGIIVQTLKNTYISQHVHYSYRNIRNRKFILHLSSLQELIYETRERFKDCQLTPEERRMFYLE